MQTEIFHSVFAIQRCSAAAAGSYPCIRQYYLPAPAAAHTSPQTYLFLQHATFQAFNSTPATSNAALLQRSPTRGFDVHGLDLEDIAVLGNGLCAGGDEYGPSIVVFDCSFSSPACGSVKKRYVPENKLGLYVAAAGEGEGGVFSGALPAIFSKRRNNRGASTI